MKYKIFAIIEKDGKEATKLDIGKAVSDANGKITCRFDCLPLTGIATLEIESEG